MLNVSEALAQNILRPSAFWTFARVFIYGQNQQTPTVLGSGRGSPRVIKDMKKIIVILVNGVLLVVVVVCSVTEKHPSPHTPEPLAWSQPIPTSTLTFSGSYAPAFSGSYFHTGSRA